MRHCQAAVIFYSYQSWPLSTSCISNCKLPLTPACLTTCCCLATFPFSDVKQTVFALLPGNRTDTFIDIYIYGYKYIFRSNSRGSRYARAFAPTDLLPRYARAFGPRFARNYTIIQFTLMITFSGQTQDKKIRKFRFEVKWYGYFPQIPFGNSGVPSEVLLFFHPERNGGKFLTIWLNPPFPGLFRAVC